MRLPKNQRKLLAALVADPEHRFIVATHRCLYVVLDRRQGRRVSPAVRHATVEQLQAAGLVTRQAAGYGPSGGRATAQAIKLYGPGAAK